MESSKREIFFKKVYHKAAGKFGFVRGKAYFSSYNSEKSRL